MKQQNISNENFQLKQTAQEAMSQVSEFDLPNLDQPLESANENNPATDYSDIPSCVGVEESGRIAYKLKLIFRMVTGTSSPTPISLKLLSILKGV